MVIITINNYSDDTGVVVDMA